MISVAVKFTNESESEEAKILRDQMLCSIIDNFNNEDVKTTESGKPYLENSNVGFSVSHSGGGILVAVNSNRKVPMPCLYFNCGKDSSVGADIEAVGKRDSERLEKVCDKYFSDAEKLLVANALDKETAILEIWTKKEAYLKLIGVGIKGIATADTELLKKDYIFHSKKTTLEGKEFVLSVSAKR